MNCEVIYILNSTKIKQLILTGIAGIVIGVSLARVSTVEAHFNPCFHNCYPHPSSSPVPTASPTSSPEPSNSPEPTILPCELSKEAEIVDCDEPTASPSATPEVTSAPVALTEAGAPELPMCTSPSWIPVVTYHGNKGNTYSYSWTYPDSSVTEFWINYGFTKDNLLFSTVVTGHSVDIKMASGNSNWISVAAYNNCLGVFSPSIN